MFIQSGLVCAPTTGLPARLNETGQAEWSIVLSLKKTAKRRSKMAGIIAPSNGQVHQEALWISPCV